MTKLVGQCCYCGQRERLTKDHILPRRTGAHLWLPCGTRNFRLCCSRCNQIREHARDCPAVVIMALAVAREARVKARSVLAAWGYIGGKQRQADTRRLLGMRAAA